MPLFVCFLWIILFILTIDFSSVGWNYQAVQIIEHSRKTQIESQEEVIQLVQLILHTGFQ